MMAALANGVITAKGISTAILPAKQAATVQHFEFSSFKNISLSTGNMVIRGPNAENIMPVPTKKLRPPILKMQLIIMESSGA